jgi:hypothetical protein
MNQLSASHHRAEVQAKPRWLWAQEAWPAAHTTSRCHTQTKMTGIDGVSSRPVRRIVLIAG